MKHRGVGTRSSTLSRPVNISVLALCVLASAGCSREPAIGTQSPPLENASIGSIDSPVVGLLYTTGDGRMEWFGSAVIVSRDPPIAFTAAHNLEIKDENTGQVGLAAPGNLRIVTSPFLEPYFDNVDAGQSIRVVDLAVPAERMLPANADTPDYDIALLRLAAGSGARLPVPATPLPASMAVTHEDADTDFVIEGYGFGGVLTGAGVRRRATMSLHTYYLTDLYDDAMSGVISRSFVIGQGNAGAPAIRSGDSGGAAFILRGCHWFLAGLVAKSEPDDDVPLTSESEHTWAAFVHVPAHEAWAVAKIQQWVLAP